MRTSDLTSSHAQMFLDVCAYLLVAMEKRSFTLSSVMAFCYAANRLRIQACDQVFYPGPFHVGGTEYPFDAPPIRHWLEGCDRLPADITPEGINLEYDGSIHITATGLIDAYSLPSLSSADRIILSLVAFRHGGMNADSMFAFAQDRFAEIKANHIIKGFQVEPIESCQVMTQGLGYSEETATAIERDINDQYRIERLFEAL